MTRPPSYGVGALALAAVLGPLLAGCGGDEPAPSASTTTSATAGASPTGPATTAPTQDASPSASAGASDDAEQGEPVDAAALDEVLAAAFDDTQGARLVVDNGLGLLGGEGVADFRRTPTALAMGLSSTETGDEQRLDVRVVDDVLYVAEGTRWLSLQVDSAANPFGSSLSDQLDPRFVLGVVREHLVSATRTGTTYTLVAEGAPVAEQLAPDLAGQDGVAVPDAVTAVLQTDAEGRATQVSLDLGADNGGITWTLEGWGTGDDVTVTAPPAGQVDPLPDLP